MASKATALRTLHKEIKATLVEDHSLHNFAATSLRRSVEQTLRFLISEPALSCVTKEELKTAISVLFWYQRKDLSDPVFANDSRAWLIQAVVALLKRHDAAFDDDLFVLHHVLR